MSEEKFKNRRGHTVSSVQEAVKSLPEPDYARQDQKIRSRKRVQFHLSKQQKRIGITVLIVLISVPVLIGEYVRMAYVGEVLQAKKSMQHIFEQVIKQQKSPVTSKTLVDANTQIASIESKLCAGGLFDNLASLYPRSKQAYEDCSVYRSRLASLDLSLKEAASQMQYLEQLQPLLAGVSKPLDDQFAVLSSQQENWQNFVGSLQQLSVPSSFKDAHNGLLTQAQAIRDQWIALVQASNAYDTATFNDVRAKLSTAYEAFKKQGNTFTNSVRQLQTDIRSNIATARQ